MAEPCENCGTPVQVVDIPRLLTPRDQVTSRRVVLGLTTATVQMATSDDPFLKPQLCEVEQHAYAASGGGVVEGISWRIHTPERCRGLRRASR